jgi:hypothetical protein
MAEPAADERPTRFPEEMNLPDQEKAREVFEALNRRGREQFLRDLLNALWDAKNRNNLRPVVDTVDEWYRSMALIHGRQASFKGAVRRAQEAFEEEEPVLAEEAQARLRST